MKITLQTEKNDSWVSQLGIVGSRFGLYTTVTAVYAEITRVAELQWYESSGTGESIWPWKLSWGV